MDGRIFDFVFFVRGHPGPGGGEHLLLQAVPVSCPISCFSEIGRSHMSTVPPRTQPHNSTTHGVVHADASQWWITSLRVVTRVIASPVWLGYFFHGFWKLDVWTLPTVEIARLISELLLFLSGAAGLRKIACTFKPESSIR